MLIQARISDLWTFGMERRVGFWKEINLLDHDIKCKDFWLNSSKSNLEQLFCWSYYWSQKPLLVNIPAQAWCMEAEFPFFCCCCCVCLFFWGFSWVFFFSAEKWNFTCWHADWSVFSVVSFLLCRKRRHSLLCCLQRALWDIIFLFFLGKLLIWILFHRCDTRLCTGLTDW